MVHVESRVEPPPVSAALLEQAAQATLDHQGAAGDLTVVLSDDEHLRELNREYLATDSPTDVLSFRADETDPDTGAPYLGDVIISVPRAASQAAAAGHSVESELRLLVVHGVLHLLGHDHADPAGKSQMWSAQAAVLKRLGLPDIVVGE